MCVVEVAYSMESCSKPNPLTLWDLEWKLEGG